MLKFNEKYIEQLLDFVGQFSIEPYLAWTIYHAYDRISFDIQWIQDKSIKQNWRIRKNNSEWLILNAKQLAQYLIYEKANLADFEYKLMNDICIQAVSSQYYIEKAKEAIGEEKVNASLEILKEITEKYKNKTTLKIVEEE